MKAKILSIIFLSSAVILVAGYFLLPSIKSDSTSAASFPDPEEAEYFKKLLGPKDVKENKLNKK